jgi:hypothetical protein
MKARGLFIGSSAALCALLFAGALATAIGYRRLPGTDAGNQNHPSIVPSSHALIDNLPVGQQRNRPAILLPTSSAQTVSYSPQRSYVEEDATPSQHISDDEKLSLARNALQHGAESQKLDAIATLIRYSPVEAAALLRALAGNARTNTISADVLSDGLFYFASVDNNAITNSDLKNFYTQGDVATQKAAAHLLGLRGDSSLAQSYIVSAAARLDKQTASERVDALFDIASIGTFEAIPYFLESLKDTDPEVRMTALLLLNRYGSNAQVADIESLRSDGSARIRAQAERVAAILWNKSIAGLYTEEQHALPP